MDEICQSRVERRRGEEGNERRGKLSFFLFLFRRFEESEEGNPSDR